MNQINYINLIDLFKHFAENHLQINKYGYGDGLQLEAATSSANAFPLFWSSLTDVSYPSNNLKTFNFNIMVLDILNIDKSNQVEIWNDAIQILEDFIKFLNTTSSNSDFNITFDSQLKITPVEQKYADLLTGGALQILIEVDFDGQNNCGLPMYDFETTFNSTNHND